ncbi:MAG TPA: DUF2911 domain-containing protein [Chitinophagaceae bacterium]
MKKILLATLLPVFFFSCAEPEKKPAGNDNPTKSEATVKVLPPVSNYTNPDRSPMDMVYFPTDYPLLKMAGKTTTPPLMRIIYSRPQKQGRQVFGGLIQYDVPWRLGANESTEIEFFSAATVAGKTVKPGRYILYCIPQETKWTFVLNSNLYSWGLEQNRQKDLMQFEVPVEKANLAIEYFTIACEKKSEKSTALIFLWDDLKAKLPVSF